MNMIDLTGILLGMLFAGFGQVVPPVGLLIAFLAERAARRPVGGFGG